MVLNTARFQLSRPGPHTPFSPRLPHVATLPSPVRVLIANAEGSNHCMVPSLFEVRVAPVFGYAIVPTRLGRSWQLLIAEHTLVPVLPKLLVAMPRFSGNPVSIVTTPESCQPPATSFNSRLPELRKKGMS